MVCLLDPADKRSLPTNCERVPYTGDRYYQHGSFLADVPGVKDDDIVILADADAVVQRDLDAAELKTLHVLGDGFALGYNAGKGQKGEYEFRLLQPKVSVNAAAEQTGMTVPLLMKVPVYNTGLVAGRVESWHHLHFFYNQHFGPGVGETIFAYPAWMQYFVCLTLAYNAIPVTELGYETHSHGHFGLSPWHAIADGRLTYMGQLVFFAHFVNGVRL